MDGNVPGKAGFLVLGPNGAASYLKKKFLRAVRAGSAHLEGRPLAPRTGFVIASHILPEKNVVCDTIQKDIVCWVQAC